MGIKRGELLVPVGTLYIVYISGVFIIINVTNFEEGTEALILRPLHLINRRVSYW
jgi:3-methyladenine DNA glycosylase Mpg